MREPWADSQRKALSSWHQKKVSRCPIQTVPRKGQTDWIQVCTTPQGKGILARKAGCKMPFKRYSPARTAPGPCCTAATLTVKQGHPHSSARARCMMQGTSWGQPGGLEEASQVRPLESEASRTENGPAHPRSRQGLCMAWAARRALGGAQPLTSQYQGPLGQPDSFQTLAPSSTLGSLQVQCPPWATPSPQPWGMSLLTNYEGLRYQIERLVRENEELKKLVRLICENRELKSAIKTQAGGLGISGFTSGLGEAAASPSQRQRNCKRPKVKEGLGGCSEEESLFVPGPQALLGRGAWM